MAEAVEQVEFQKMSMYEAARTYEIPKSTLARHVQGTVCTRYKVQYSTLARKYVTCFYTLRVGGINLLKRALGKGIPQSSVQAWGQLMKFCDKKQSTFRRMLLQRPAFILILTYSMF